MQETRTLLAKRYKKAFWTQFSLFTIAIWLIASPAMLSYESMALRVSDIVSGFLLLVMVALALSRQGGWVPWVTGAIGGWLLLAPLIFWASTAEAYTNDTIAGLLVIGFAVVVPYMQSLPGPNVPVGWSYNPSSWHQRLPIIILALISFLMSRYMSAFQLGHLSSVWDPFFTPGTRAVLESSVSKSWPVSDAGLGAVSYALDAIAGLIGGTARWRTMPWIVILFGIFIFPLGIVSITLVILQPVAVGAWCTLCLMTALIAMLMIPFALDEVGASLQYLRTVKQNGHSLWDAFWFGGPMLQEGAKTEHEGPVTLKSLGKSFAQVMIGPWNLLLTIPVGIWLMASPSLLPIQDMAQSSNVITGALAITFAIIAFVGIARSLRLVNVLIGLWLLIAPWVLAGFGGNSPWWIAVTGLVLIGLSIPKGKIGGRFGMWEPYII